MGKSALEARGTKPDEGIHAAAGATLGGAPGSAGTVRLGAMSSLLRAKRKADSVRMASVAHVAADAWALAAAAALASETPLGTPETPHMAL